jgi:methanogenic corrinoid protein MtbC1
VPLPTRPERIVIGCPPEEEHTFGLLLLTLLLKRSGFYVLYLGANVPVERLEATIAATKPHLVIMSAQQLHTAATLLEAAQVLQKQGVRFAYGGLVFNMLPALHHRIPGHYLGESLDLAPQTVERVFALSPLPGKAEAVSTGYQSALEHYRERKALIEAQVWEGMERIGMSRGYITVATMNLSRNIMAALVLGDMEFIGVDIDWVAGLLSNHRLPVDLLRDYLKVYYQAVKTQMDDRGQPIISWLGRVSVESSR